MDATHYEGPPRLPARRDEAITKPLFAEPGSPALLQWAALLSATIGYPIAWILLMIIRSLSDLDRTLRHIHRPSPDMLDWAPTLAFWVSWAAALVMMVLGRRAPSTAMVSAACTVPVVCVMVWSAVDTPPSSWAAIAAIGTAVAVAGLSLASRRS